MSRREILEKWVKESDFVPKTTENDQELILSLLVTLNEEKSLNAEFYVHLEKLNNFVSVFGYIEDFRVSDKNRTKFFEVLNSVNLSISMGHFELLDEGQVRYKIAIDPGKKEIETCLLNGMLGAAHHWLEEYHEKFIAY